MRSHSVEAGSKPRKERKGIFVRILEMLYHSRCREAKRVFRHYRHLTVEDAQVRSADPAPESRHAEESSRNAEGDRAPVRPGRRPRREAGTQFA
jgi:hypothetical protein